MSDLEIKSLNITDKVLFLDEYLSKFSNEELKKGKGLVDNKIDENGLIELDEEFDDGRLTNDVEKAVKNIYKKMNLDSKDGISNEDLIKFNAILEKIGLKPSEIAEVFNQYDIKTDVSSLSTKKVANATLEEFKSIVANYPAINDLLEEVGYERFFNIVDKNHDGVITTIEMALNADNFQQLTVDDIKKLLSKNGVNYTDTAKQVKEDIDENEDFQKLLEELKQVLKIGKYKDNSAVSVNAGNEAAANLAKNTLSDTTSAQTQNYTPNYTTTASSGNSYDNYSAPMQTSYTTSYTTQSVPTVNTTYTYEPVDDTEADAVTKATIESLAAEIEKLEGKKKDEQGNFRMGHSNLTAVQNDEEKSVKEKKDDMDKAQANYKELLETNAKKVPAVAAYKKQLEENEVAIKDNAKNIQTEKNNLSFITDSIDAQKICISGLKTAKNALETSLNTAKRAIITEENKDSIQAKIKQLNEQIKAKEAEIKKQNQALAQMEDEKESLEGKIKQLETNETELKQTRTKLEESLEQTADKATKQALDTYQAARTAYEIQKEAKTDEANAMISSAKEEITEIQKQIDTLEAQKIIEENKLKEVKYKKVEHTTTTYEEVKVPVTTPVQTSAPAVTNLSYTAPPTNTQAAQTSEPVVQAASSNKSAFSQYNAQKGSALASAANSLYGNVTKGGGLCATGVSQAITKALGYTTHGNGCDYGNVLSKRSDWLEVTDQVKTVEDLKALPAGSIVSWSAYNTTSLGRLYGHVYICDGNGHGLSDFKENIGGSYWNRGSKCRVFIPV